ncbi:MAG: hypothetical protein AB9M60_00370 [Leptothrix sp. (in: b-proteobacteria)]
MTPPEVLADLRARGFRLRITPAGTIGVTPAERLTAADLVLIRTHRAGLLALLAGAPLPEPSCTSCAHRTPANTCGVPDLAGLCPPDRFRLEFCDLLPDGGTRCPAWAPDQATRNPA